MGQQKTPKGPLLLMALLFLSLPVYWLLEVVGQPKDLDWETRKAQVYLDSATCETCHGDRYASWRRTFHSTMTAPADEAHVLAPIDGQVDLNFYGYAVRFEKEERRFFVTLPWLDGSSRRMEIIYTIGSRRMQQFAVRANQKTYRIPVFYNLSERRWQHLNDAFFRQKAGGLENFTKGYALWDANCLFCHNTRPNPGMDYPHMSFQATVGEFGIACEECHGPGRLHAQYNRNPLRRLWLQMGERTDASIVHPEKLAPLESIQICGQCHGQRLPKPRSRIKQLMTEGDPFTAGENLDQYYEPLQIHSTLDGMQHLRFWGDGSPRLTAYEYQGLRASPCFSKAGLRCIDCHTMHGGDPAGMIDGLKRTDQACLPCHSSLGEPGALEKHAGHQAHQASCYDCHMPEVVYGVMSVHKTHLIRNPDPRRTLNYNMPNACNLCHLDQSVNWAIRKMAPFSSLELEPGNRDFDNPEYLRGFAVGDAVYRLIILDRVRRSGIQEFEPLLRRGLEDPYYSVNHFTRRVLYEWYGKRFDKDEDWLAFLNQEAAPSPAQFNRLRAARGPDPPFEFGE